MRENDLSYYRRRAETEAYLAQNGKCPKAVAAHHRLATLYLDRAEGREEPRPTSHD